MCRTKPTEILIIPSLSLTGTISNVRQDINFRAGEHFFNNGASMPGIGRLVSMFPILTLWSKEVKG